MTLHHYYKATIRVKRLWDTCQILGEKHRFGDHEKINIVVPGRGGMEEGEKMGIVPTVLTMIVGVALYFHLFQDAS